MVTRKKSKYNLDEVSPKDIVHNPDNPRGETKEQIFADKEFTRLKDSVYEFGVLVPLVVHRISSGSKKFQLIDGERRWRAAIATNLDKVPVNIIEGDDPESEELRRTFQIHMLRKQWSKTSQARALRLIVNQVKKESEIKNKAELFQEIQDTSGYTETQLKDMLRALKYGPKILDEVDSNKSSLRWSHLIQIEASFIEQLDKLYPDIIKDYGKKSIRKRMLEKVRKGIISTTRDLMDDLLPVFMESTKQKQKKYLGDLLIDFIDKPSMQPQDVVKKFTLKYPINVDDLVDLIREVSEILNKAGSMMDKINVEQLKAYPKLKKMLLNSMDALKRPLNKLTRKLK